MVNKTEATMSQFKTWEEMSELEQARCIYSDMYKEVYGVRPRGVDIGTWTMEEFERQFDGLQSVIDRQLED